jgi:hypothetical protein
MINYRRWRTLMIAPAGMVDTDVPLGKGGSNRTLPAWPRGREKRTAPLPASGSDLHYNASTSPDKQAVTG